MRRFLAAALLCLLAGCGGSGTGAGSGRELNVALDAEPAGRHAGLYLAMARGYDTAAGTELAVKDPADLRLVGRAELDRERAVAVMAVLQDELFLATDRVTLDEREEDVRAAVEALQRGYEETIVDPEGAVAAMVAAGAGGREALMAQLDLAAPGFKRGAENFGELRGVPAELTAPGFVRPSDR